MRATGSPYPHCLIRAVVVLLLLCLVLPASASAATGLIVARKSTFETIKGLLAVTSIHILAGRQFICGDYMGRRVVLVRSPMGQVNNTITTQMLLSKFEIDLVISIAPAGAISDKVDIGNIVLADQVYQHDFGTVKPYGFIWGKAPDGEGWEEAGYNSHPNAPNLDQVLQRLGEKEPPKVLIGPVVSGDQLIASREKRGWLQSKFNALAVDMSAAAIVQTCFANGVRCQIIRIVTDHADESARSDFEASFTQSAQEPNYQMLFKVIMAVES